VDLKISKRSARKGQRGAGVDSCGLFSTRQIIAVVAVMVVVVEEELCRRSKTCNCLQVHEARRRRRRRRLYLLSKTHEAMEAMAMGVGGWGRKSVSFDPMPEGLKMYI